MLTRSYLLTDLECILFYKLANFISICTPDELQYFRKIPYDFKSKNTIIISSLYLYGLFTQEEKESGEIVYILSDFAQALKCNALNFDNGLDGQNRICSYAQLTPFPITEPATWKSLSEWLNREPCVHAGRNII